MDTQNNNNVSIDEIAEPYVTVDKYAEHWSVSKQRVRAWIRAGRMQSATRLGRFWRVRLSDIPTSVDGLCNRPYIRAFRELDKGVKNE